MSVKERKVLHIIEQIICKSYFYGKENSRLKPIWGVLVYNQVTEISDDTLSLHVFIFIFIILIFLLSLTILKSLEMQKGRFYKKLNLKHRVTFSASWYKRLTKVNFVNHRRTRETFIEFMRSNQLSRANSIFCTSKIITILLNWN